MTVDEGSPKPDLRSSPFINAIMIAAAVVVVIGGIHLARAIVIPFLLAIFIGVIISAILEWLRQRDINTGAAIFLMMVFMAVSSLVVISVVATSANELVSRLPELNSQINKAEEKVVDWLEARGFKVQQQDNDRPASQSLEISVPGLVPLPEMSSGAAPSPEGTSLLPPPDGTSAPSIPTESGLVAPEATSTLPQAEMLIDPDEAIESADGPGDRSDPTKESSDGLGDMLRPGRLDRDDPSVSEPIVVESQPSGPLGIPGYMFGEQRHVIEFHPSSGRSTSTRNEGVLNVLSPVQIFRSFLESVMGMLNYTLIVLLMLLFLLFEWSRFGKKLEALPGDSQLSMAQVAAVLAAIRKYMLIKTIVSVMTGLLIGFGLMLLGTDYAALWGVIAFLFNYIPTIGSIIAGIVPVLYVLVDQDPWAASYVAAVFLSVNFVIGNVLEPRIMGEGLGLSTFVVFLSLIFWGWVLGPAGMLLAVPLTMVVKIVLASDERTRWFALLLGSGTDIDSVSHITR
ncbi:AI-2E family transporter [Rubinisphaera margarita]|uniref:AI-2E family transporter n=1 Tax=Rubinisphaera margarita TaxID=2909586 RepID=UPI001EE8A8DC|nr:AI-2E family transporter [Rubinisphaera margarita]MCG6157873.1 AI-2E family transporter [Rubinisphaera margarita]